MERKFYKIRADKIKATKRNWKKTKWEIRILIWDLQNWQLFSSIESFNCFIFLIDAKYQNFFHLLID